MDWLSVNVLFKLEARVCAACIQIAPLAMRHNRPKSTDSSRYARKYLHATRRHVGEPCSAWKDVQCRRRDMRRDAARQPTASTPKRPPAAVSPSATSHIGMMNMADNTVMSERWAISCLANGYQGTPTITARCRFLPCRSRPCLSPVARRHAQNLGTFAPKGFPRRWRRGGTARAMPVAHGSGRRAPARVSATGKQSQATHYFNVGRRG